ncbi:ABC transporter substrate-binding protein [Thermogemmatispora carboxidivorans]|uniref:ABC transporter substrate-binding protein n=1 Tax=Thermogemmatispora carboxidivorans TaxID=1382306 RepID=UPI0009DDEA39|nr:ABC transporter substrate-binding protein [Thermogemmatispora carboxidivorans]
MKTRSQPLCLVSACQRLAGALCILLSLGALLLSACGGSAQPTGTRTDTLRVLPAPNGPNADLFNPFFNYNTPAAWGAQGLLYEVLYSTDFSTGEYHSWLATSYNFSSDNTQLTFHLRPNVKWNDGQPFTSADVKFTFDLMKDHPALDQGGVSALIKNITTPDDETVTFTLTGPNSTALFYVGQTYIVPQHAWSSISGDPAKFTNDKNPVGTGPYKLRSFSADLIIYDVNPSYWGGQPAVKHIYVYSAKDNTTAITNMIQGKYDWMGSAWTPDFDKQFKSKDPQHNKTWSFPSNTVMLYLNLYKAPFNSVLVRKAISAAINRDNLPQGVAYYAKPAHPTAIIPPRKDWIAPEYQNATFQYSVSQAQSYLKQAGYTQHSDGYFYDSSGKVLGFSIIVPSSWSDWAQDVQFIVNDLNKAGIKATMNGLADANTYFSAIYGGNYEAAIGWTDKGPTPYYPYRDMLSSSNSAPPGKPVSGTNFGRWDTHSAGTLANQVDQLLKQYMTSTDVNVQKQAIQGIEKIIVEQLPAIPLTVNVDWDEHTTRHWTGWPDDSNPNIVVPTYQVPDVVSVILHLKPTS